VPAVYIIYGTGAQVSGSSDCPARGDSTSREGVRVIQGPLVRKEWLIAMAIMFVSLVAVLYVIAGSESS
jgi:hypothetical protein